MHVSADGARLKIERPIGLKPRTSIWTHIPADDSANSYHNRKQRFEVRVWQVGGEDRYHSDQKVGQTAA